MGGFPGLLRPDEVPTIVKRDEGIFTPEQMRALGGPRMLHADVTINNESGVQLAAREASVQIDGDRLIVGVVVDSINPRLTRHSRTFATTSRDSSTRTTPADCTLR